MTVAIRARLPRLASLPDEPQAAESLLQETRYLLSLFKTTEARQVARALGDSRFPFGMIQEELAALRQTFAKHVREFAQAQSFGKAQRCELLEMAQLAEEAGVSKRTVERVEAGGSTQMVTIVRIFRVLNLLGELDRLVPQAGPRPLDLLKRKGKVRKRASSSRHEQVIEEEWSWGDDS